MTSHPPEGPTPPAANAICQDCFHQFVAHNNAGPCAILTQRLPKSSGRWDLCECIKFVPPISAPVVGAGDETLRTPATALPSELIEVSLQGALVLCIRELRDSAGTLADFRSFADQLRGIDRVAMCNQDGAVGVHASIAAAAEMNRALTMLDWSESQRQAFIAEIRNV